MFFDLVLSDPSEATWKHDDILKLRRHIRQAVLSTDLPISLYARLSPATDEPQADDEVALAL